MKLKTYKEYLEMTTEEIEERLAPIRAMQAKMQAELEIAKLDEKIITLESEITSLCTKNPIAYDRIINKQDEMQLVERRRNQFNKIIGQLFYGEPLGIGSLLV